MWTQLEYMNKQINEIKKINQPIIFLFNKNQINKNVSINK